MGVQEEYDIPVIFEGEEKLMTGLTKRTTCDDVLYAILQHQCGVTGSDLHLEVANYIICERWRHIERPLRGRTKLVKAWRAWASEQHNVRFIVFRLKSIVGDDVSSLASIDKSGTLRRRRSKKHKERHSRFGSESESESVYKNRFYKHFGGAAYKTPTAQVPADAIPNDHIYSDDYITSYELSRKSQAKLAKDKSSHSRSNLRASNVPRSEQNAFRKLVELVLHQEKVIQEQRNNITKIDMEIRDCEVRMQTKSTSGQEATSGHFGVRPRESSEDSGLSADEIFSNLKSNDLNSCMYFCENILALEESISEEEHKIENLSTQIFEASFHIENDAKAGHATSQREPVGLREKQIDSEEVRLRVELDKCLSLGLSFFEQIDSMNKKMENMQGQLQVKKDYINHLLAEIDEAENDKRASTSVKHVRFEANKNEHVNYENLTPVNRDNTINLSACTHEQDSMHQKPNSSNAGLMAHVDPSCRNAANFYDAPGLPDPYIKAENKANYTGLRTSILRQEKLTYIATGLTDCQSEYAKGASGSGDSESDTGLSSMHSDDCQHVLETLV